ncbi:MAG: 30S ribosome-binding factor RbfA [Acidobacteriota bacterium]
MESRRAQRVSEALREELAELVGYELKDPRLAGVTVVDCHLSPDGRHAQVAVALRGPDAERRGALEALDHARHHLRHEVAGRLRLFRAPELHFVEDAAGGGESRIDQLLKRIHKTRAGQETGSGPGGPPHKESENSPQK